MAGEKYPSPPITEAVIEIRFAAVIDEALRRKASDRFADIYPVAAEQRLSEISVDLDHANVKIDTLPPTFRRSNRDENEILLINPQSLGVSQLAVYPGWDHFFGRFERDWRIWKSIGGFNKLERVGMRFINRIDVPLVDNIARHEDYLTVQVQLPPEYLLTIGYSLNARLPLHDIKSFANVNSGTTESPVPGHAAFLLDIDILRAVDPPSKDGDIIDLLHAMRSEKNRLFESFIKDAARERFRHDQSLR